MLAVEAPADDVPGRFLVIGLGVGELLEPGCRDPPLAAAVVHRRAEEVRRVDALRAGEAAAFVAAMVTVLGARMPARQELISQTGGELERAFSLPFAVEALAFRLRGQIRCPDQTVVEEVLLQDELRLELAHVR